jgi:hypothetical protein
MVQCTKQEFVDAQVAQQWIDLINALPNATRLINNHQSPLAGRYWQIIARYGPIFQSRTLLCPRCLGVRYGNHPETVRQGWRRRNNKPDATVAGNLPTLDITLSHRGEVELQRIRESIQLAGLRGDGKARQRQRARRKRMKELQKRDRETDVNDVLKWLKSLSHP